MKKQISIGSAILSVLVGLTLAARDKYTVNVPNGLAFSEFKGYEDWQVVAVSQTESQNVIRVILGNPLTINAYRKGIPGNGKPFPDGSRIAKILWKPNTIVEAPFSPSAPDVVSGVPDAVELIVKDTRRFPDTHGWGYAKFNYDAAAATFKPFGTGASCGATCHSPAAKKDFVFTEYSRR